MNANPHGKIPPTQIVERFRNLPGGQEDRMADAAQLADSCGEINALAYCLTTSVHQFDAQYGATTEPFHPAREGKQPSGTRLTLDRADNLGLRLSGLWLVENDEALDFFYVDREVPVAHRKEHPRFADDIKTDLILGNAHDGTPIVAEVKRADPDRPMNADADPYYALMQALAAVSLLATPSQRERLAMHSLSEFALKTDGPLDLYLIALNPAAGTWQGKLAEVVERIAQDLLDALDPGSPLRTIAMLDMWEDGRMLRITKRWKRSLGNPAASARAALARALKALRPDATFDQKGYTATLEMNLLAGISEAMIEAEYGGAAGGELKQKMRAPWSSSALVVNSFAPWRQAETTTMPVAVVDGLPATFNLEAKCPNGVSHTPPHLDVLFDCRDSIVAVESKLIEYLAPKKRVPAKAYLALETTGDPRASSKWFQVLHELHHFELLDAYQLVKHYLGLRHTYPTKPITLLYLFWEPTNAGEYLIFGKHSAEIAAFAALVADDPTGTFRRQSYPEYWAALEHVDGSPDWLASHLDYLRARYAVCV